MRRPTALAAALALALAGCGDEGDEPKSPEPAGRQDPVTMVQEYVDAFAAGDFAAACESATEQAVRDVTKGGERSCAEVYEAEPGIVERTREQFRGATARDAEIDGDRGTVTIETKAGAEVPVPVLREDGTWKVGR